MIIMVMIRLDMLIIGDKSHNSTIDLPQQDNSHKLSDQATSRS